jgi:TraM protein/uncharacterized protein DUF4138
MKPFILNAANKKFLLVLPGIGVPFLCLIFFALGGGRGDKRPTGPVSFGLNFELPKARFNPKQAFLDKLKVYENAEHDSLRKQQYQRMDPYRRDSNAVQGGSGQASSVAAAGPHSRGLAVGPMYKDPKAEQLLRQLDGLRQSLQRPQPPAGRATPPASARNYSPGGPKPEDSGGDAQIGKLNSLLDKVIRIQHPEEGRVAVSGSRLTDEVVPADPGINAIAAVIAEDQILVNGATIALRITDSIRVNGHVLAGGQLVYGIVTLNNDRMSVHVGSLREDRNLFLTDLQVYDMDGIAGIHIPGVLSRDVAKQSADQGVNSLTILNADPSPGAQAASAGIQTVKAFAGRKVRQIRVAVRAGYQVLLRNPRATANKEAAVFIHKPAEGLRPPGFVPGGTILTHCRDQGVELALRAVVLADSCLWFGLEWANRSPIPFYPAYARWFTRDRRAFRRTAMQEITLEPVTTGALVSVGADSVVSIWAGFTPFALAKDKELVLGVGEKAGGRTLELVIGYKSIMKAKEYVREKRDTAVQ